MLRLILIGLLLCLAIAGCQRMVTVSSGTKVVCSVCGRTMNADIQTLQVSAQEAPKYSVHETMKICPACQAKIAEQKRQEEVRQRAEAVRQEKQRLAESRGRLAGTWRGGQLHGWDVAWFLSKDGTGTLQMSGLGGWSESITWNTSGDYLNIEVLSWKEKDGRKSAFSGKYKTEGNTLIVAHGWGQAFYTRQ